MFTLGVASTQSAVRPATDTKLLIRGARQVITLQGPPRMRVGDELESLPVLRDASILIENGRISQIGSSRRVENLSAIRNARWIDARRLVVLPGFVDVTRDLAVTESGDHTRRSGGPGDDLALGSGLLSRRVTHELQRLALAGSTFVRASFEFPSDMAERARLLRHLLRVDLPAAAFQAALRIQPGILLRESPRGTTLRDLVSPPARQHLRELAPLLAADFSSTLLTSLEPAQRYHLLRAVAREMPCQISGAERCSVAELLDLGLAADCLAEGVLPGNRADMQRLAQWGVRWIMTVGGAALRGEPSIGNLSHALHEGVQVALATGYCPGVPGVHSPLALLALLRQQSGLGVGALLQLQIANTAHALGVGHRMGSLECGKEANLVLVDCDDFRELGLYLGAPRVVATLCRGQVLGAADAFQPNI